MNLQRQDNLSDVFCKGNNVSKGMYEMPIPTSHSMPRFVRGIHFVHFRIFHPHPPSSEANRGPAFLKTHIMTDCKPNICLNEKTFIASVLMPMKSLEKYAKWVSMVN